jgi:hypothetical protein
MTATIPSTALATIQPAFTDAERLALAGFLAGYRGLTREAYTLNLRQFTGWCRARSLPLFSVRRADIETFALELEARGRARATVTRRAGIAKHVGPHTLRHAFITAALDAGVPLRDVQEAASTPTRAGADHDVWGKDRERGGRRLGVAGTAPAS